MTERRLREVDRTADRKTSIAAHRAAGGQVALVFPIHPPRALLSAFGLLPVEVWGPPRIDTSDGDTHLQAYVCSIVRAGLSFVVGRDGRSIADADIIVVPHACDSLQGLASLLLDLRPPRPPVIPIYLPRGERASDIAFLAEEFRSAGVRISGLLKKSPSEAEFHEAVLAEERADELLAALHRHRASLGLGLRALYDLFRSREYLSATAFSELAKTHLMAAGVLTRGRIRKTVQKSAPPGVPILLSGIVPEPPSVLDHIESAGGFVVADDLACCGRRLYPAGQSDDPFRRMAERLISGPPDPTRGSPVAARANHLIALAEETGAKGVMFYTVKFCEPEWFDLPLLADLLAAAGLPSTAIEVDITQPLSQQTETRIDAFLEMLS